MGQCNETIEVEGQRRRFRSLRQLMSDFGLVSREHSSGNRERRSRGRGTVHIVGIIVLLALAALTGRWLGVGAPFGDDEPETNEELQQRLVGKAPAGAFFASGEGRALLEESHRRPVAIFVFRWSECLTCAAEMVEWGRLAGAQPNVRAVEVMTRRLPSDIEAFVAGTGVMLPVLVDSSTSISEVSGHLPLHLLLDNGVVRHAMAGLDWAARFWSDVAALTADTGGDGVDGAAMQATATCAPAPTATLAVVPFATYGTVVETKVLPDEGPLQVMGVSSLDLSMRGRRLVADGRQRRVFLFDSSMANGRVIGREGEGPGEYRAPRYAVFGPDGSLSVLDISLGRIVQFDSTGRFIRTVRTPSADPRAILALPNGGYLIAGNTSAGGRQRLLTRVDANGGVRWIAVPTDTIFHALDMIVGGAWAVRGGDDEALVGLTVAPTISRVSLTDGSVTCRSAIPQAAWRQLSPADRPKTQTLTSMRDWIERATAVIGAARTADGRLVLTTSRMAEGREVQEWLVFDGRLAPVAHVVDVPGRAIAAQANDLVVIGEDDDGWSTLQRVRLRGARTR